MFYGVVQTIIAVNATGDSSNTLFTDLQTLIAGIVARLFPYNKKKQAPADRTKQDFNVLKKFLDASNYTIGKKD